MTTLAAVALNPDSNLLTAALPLLEEEMVDAIEWSFDAVDTTGRLPAYFHDLLQFYASHHRLIGHGIYFSAFSGKWTPDQQEWLSRLAAVCRQFPLEQVTEHFGFMTGKDFHKGAPLNIPRNAATLAIGRDRLARIRQACNCPVGLENLAFSYSLEETRHHGAFLAELVEPVNGFIILDLHNCYCQAMNFSVDADRLLDTYPLHLVREIHISGGSWEPFPDAPGGMVRRDTHDDSVPQEVFDLLQLALRRCPNVRYVTLEQLSTALETTSAQEQFCKDFRRMRGMMAIPEGERQQAASGVPQVDFHRPIPLLTGQIPVEDMLLYQQQRELAGILESSEDLATAQKLLRNSSLAASDWKIENWAPYMVETARQIARKWK
ncbi:multinuclear nonheme iron-dependent oxidase [Flavihumibacter petaseus]|uniref:DUF692 family protein n=1 Tax=Flavihumibacter petaseus NBRC 106054 TaxID=1220578 RepID=A0A0E9N0R1_9BACT|nr:DUF692 family multinuclear iron-containing protein [Flavihumibacter petaseus]GAO43236.1 hypothetical protein FPE01S_02_03400 [Flavihumibacter petaseus NBRC 106054]